MREVEVSLEGWRMADVLGEMRKWLDHNNCIPLNFEIGRSAAGALVVRIQFREDDMAEAFKRDFGV
jgi:hypothetical protein